MQIRNKKKILLKIYNRNKNENISSDEEKLKIEEKSKIDEETNLVIELISKIEEKEKNSKKNFLLSPKISLLCSPSIKNEEKLKIFNISPLFKKKITKNFNINTKVNKKITFDEKNRFNSLDTTILENNLEGIQKYFISKNKCNCKKNCLSENCGCHLKNFTCSVTCECSICFNTPLLKKKIKKRRKRIISYFGLNEFDMFKSFNKINDVNLSLKKDFEDCENIGNDFFYDKTGSFYLRKLNF